MKIKVGDAVGYKEGYEKYGTVVAIQGSRVTIEYWDSEEGRTRRTVQPLSRVWKED